MKQKSSYSCLVIQMARLGDTLQSLMALRAAKQLYPQLRITFLAHENFSVAARRVSWIDEVIEFPTDEILQPVLKGKKTEAQGVQDVARWLAPLVNDRWDFIVNWSFSEASSYLTGLLPARVKLGYSRRSDGTFSCSDGWSHYIQAIIQAGTHQNIHLTDILTTQLLTALQIHIGEPADAGSTAVTSKSFFNIKEGSRRDIDRIWRNPMKKWVGIQLGTAHSSKTWDPEKWAQVAYSILSRQSEYSVILMGGAGDKPLERQFKEAFRKTAAQSVMHERLISFVGQTDFDLWSEIVTHCQWIMSGDTAAIHLASVLGTRVFNVSVGPVRWAETGPYGNGHYVLSANAACEACEKREKTATHICGQNLSAEAVYAAWSYASSEWIHRRQLTLAEHFSRLDLAGQVDSISLYRSKIRPTEEGGGVVYESLVDRTVNVQQWNSQVIGYLARAWYCGWVPEVGQELTRKMVHPSLIQDLRALEEGIDVLSKVCIEAERTSRKLHEKGSKLRSDKIMKLSDRETLQELGAKAMELDQLFERVARSHVCLNPFSQVSKVMMHNLKGDEIAELSRESAQSYQLLNQGISILKEWVKYTLDLAKPVAIHGTNVFAIHPGKPPGRDLSP